jgi:hypothetical protein
MFSPARRATVDAERVAAGGEAVPQRGDHRDGGPQPLARTRLIGLARGGHEAGDMRLMLNRLAGPQAKNKAPRGDAATEAG